MSRKYTKEKDEDDKEENTCRSVVRLPNENGESINSKAVVKFQMVQSLANYSQLQCNTDLKLPPSNWLMASMNWYGLRQTLIHGLNSFRMAHMFPECVGGGIDVITSAENIKKILKLPYSPKSVISLMVHRVDNTLLIDDFDLCRFLLQRADAEWPWLKTFLINQGFSTGANLAMIKNKSREALRKKSLLSKFLHHSLMVPEDDETATQQRTQSDETGSLPLESLNEDVSNLSVVHSLNEIAPDLPEPSLQGNVPPHNAQSNFIHNRNVMWTFEDIRMLIGTDMPIFGSDTRPCISLRLRDMGEPINVLTGIDYWLDNLMCNVPEVVMCYHLDGLVQKYEIIKTEDLPYLENSTFSPQVVRNVAQHILAFLKQKATKAGHTYWLFKGRNDDFVKLYDLTTLSMGQEETMRPPPPSTSSAAAASSSSSSSSKPSSSSAKSSSTSQKEVPASTTSENPFTVPVGMLLYKVAKNMKNINTTLTNQQAGSIKALLDNCIKLLSKEKYPKIVASSHYILSDLYIPIGSDPNANNIQFCNGADSDTQSVYDDEKYQNDTKSYDDATENVADQLSINKLTGTISMESIKDEFTADDKCDDKTQQRKNQFPPPIANELDERCQIALNHIAEGLSCLQFISQHEEKLTQEKAKHAQQAEKERIIYEEQHPILAKSAKAIPMPYTASAQNLNEAIPMGWKAKNNVTKTELPPPATPGKKSKKARRKAKKNTPKKETDETNAAQDQQLLEVRNKIEATVPWSVHLRLLLLEKATLVYEILSKQAYEANEYGHSIKYATIAMKCQKVVLKYFGSKSETKIEYNPIQLEIAADCFYQLSRNTTKIKRYLKDYESERPIDQPILQEIERELEPLERFVFLPKPGDNVEMLMVTSCACYERALATPNLTEKARKSLLSRMGCAKNDFAVQYLTWAETEHAQFKEYMQEQFDKLLNTFKSNPTKAILSNHIQDKMNVYQRLIDQSFQMVNDGLKAFELVGDSVNQAIVLLTLGRFWRVRAHLVGNLSTSRGYYAESFASYRQALNILKSTDDDTEQITDIVTWELITSRLSFIQQLVNADSSEHEPTIIDLIDFTLHICYGGTGIRYTLRCCEFYQIYITIYRRQFKRESVVRKGELIKLIREYYVKIAAAYELANAAPKMQLEILIERMKFEQNETFQHYRSSAIGKMTNFRTLLKVIVNSTSIFDNVLSDKENADDLLQLLEEFERNLQQILKIMTKLTMEKIFSDEARKIYKKAFGLSLRSLTKLNVESLTMHLKELLTNITKGIGQPIMKTKS